MRKKEIPCNICGKKDVKVIIFPNINNVSSSDIFSAAGGIRGTQRIVRCNNCNLVYVSPRFSQEEIEKGYKEASDHGHSSQETGRKKTFEKGIELISSLYGKKGKLLDVGCANGVFVEVASSKGWDSYGIELSRELVNIGQRKKLKLIQGTLSEAKFKKQSFDVITFWDVLEHVSDPRKELGYAYDLLRPGGLLLVNFPDFGSLPARLAGKNWWFILSVHLYYFTRSTITKIGERVGFKPLEFHRHWQYLELGYLAGMLSIYNKLVSRVAKKIFDIFQISRILIPYYAGQSTIVFKKNAAK